MTRGLSHSLDGVGSLGEDLGMIALRADGAGEVAAGLLAGFQLTDDMAEIVFGAPTEVAPGFPVDVDPVDAREQAPAAAPIFGFAGRHPPAHDGGGIVAQSGEVFRPERCGRADDVAAKADRRCALHRLEVGAHGVLQVGPAKQEFVDLGGSFVPSESFGRDWPRLNGRVHDLWRMVGGPAPPAGRGTGTGTGTGSRELLIALDGDKAGKEAREIAEEIWDADKVAEEWYRGCPLRGTVRRRIYRARYLMEVGYLKLAAQW